MPTLETASLRLRPVLESDIGALHEIWTDPAVRRFLWDDVEIDRRTAEAVVEQSCRDWREHRYGLWLVEMRATNELAGFIGFRTSPDDAHPELLFGLLPRFWHMGLATEAGRVALTYLFATPQPERAWAATDPPNQASVRIMERLGMRFERRGRLNGLETLFFEIEKNAWSWKDEVSCRR